MLDNKSYYDRFAAGYEKGRHHGYHLLVDELEAGLVCGVAAGRSVLEVGCGTGLILERVARVAREAKGVDLSPGMLAKARSRGLDVREGEATALPFADESFDVTYSFKVLSHVPDLGKALAEIARVTRPGGAAFIELYNRRSLRYLIRRLRGGLPIADGIHDNQVFVRFYSLPELLALLPASLRLEALHGIRVFTTWPGLLSLPGVGRGLSWAERRATSSWLGRFGGFLVLACRKVAA
jgi:ubiquinone/menaquinone biosynthesis C-methylase UbiE